jgi:hypothetical protein
MQTIDVIDKTVAGVGFESLNIPLQTPLEYVVPGGKRSFWTGSVPVEGKVAACMCAACGRILLYGRPRDDTPPGALPKPPEWIVQIAELQQSKAPRRAVYECLRKHRIPHPVASQQANGFRAGRQVQLPLQERERAQTMVAELRSLGLVAEVVEPTVEKERG